MSLTDFDIGQIITALIFFGSILISSLPTMNPRNSISCLWNSVFSGLTYKSALISALSTLLIYILCFYSISEYTTILSRYTVTNISKYCLRMLLMNAWNIADAFVNPNGITKYL